MFLKMERFDDPIKTRGNQRLNDFFDVEDNECDECRNRRENETTKHDFENPKDDVLHGRDKGNEKSDREQENHDQD